MGREERFVQIFMDGEPHTFLTFSICDDYKPYEEKELWEYLPQNPNGKICFIETLASRGFERDLLRRIEEIIVKKYPQVEGAVWFRPDKNGERKVIYRRRHYEASLRN